MKSQRTPMVLVYQSRKVECGWVEGIGYTYCELTICTKLGGRWSNRW